MDHQIAASLVRLEVVRAGSLLLIRDIILCSSKGYLGVNLHVSTSMYNTNEINRAIVSQGIFGADLEMCVPSKIVPRG